jgi:heat shock protein HslJ
MMIAADHLSGRAPMRTALAFSALAIAAPAVAATPQSYSVADQASAAACRAASGLREATVGPATRFSDAFLMDVRTVTGTWPQRHMKGAKAAMLCLYNRRTRRAETQEVATAAPPPPAAAPEVDMSAFRDVWWQVAEIDGRKPLGPRLLTLMLGSDGKIGGNSGCNGYSANYQLTGTAMKVFPPMIGTRMACPPRIMDQETAYRALLERAAQATAGPAGSLIVTAADGRALRFTPVPKGLR